MFELILTIPVKPSNLRIVVLCNGITDGDMFGKSGDLEDMRKWRVWKLKLIDARLYFVSIFVGLLTGLVAVPYHYLLQFFFNTRRNFFDSQPHWYWHIPIFLSLCGILLFVMGLVKK